MIHSGNLDFSFSGLKTAVLYYIRDNKPETDALRADLARAGA
jgi:tRNA A37 threonylcarbamoyltransferase TsaD